MADNIFEGQEPAPAPQEPATSMFQVGDRQYDMDAAKKKIENADSHISRIEEENKRMREEVEALKAKASQAQTVEDALAMLQSQQAPQEPQQQSPSAAPQTLDMDTLLAQAQAKAQEVANATVQQAQLKAVQEANLTDSITHAKTQFGDEYQTKLTEVGQSIGLDQNGINELAKTNPAMFKRLFQAPKAPTSVAPDAGIYQGKVVSSNSELSTVVDGLFGNNRPFGGTEKAKAWLAADKLVGELINKGKI